MLQMTTNFETNLSNERNQYSYMYIKLIVCTCSWYLLQYILQLFNTVLFHSCYYYSPVQYHQKLLNDLISCDRLTCKMIIIFVGLSLGLT